MSETNSFLKEIIKTSNDIWTKGWAERNAGNISVRLDTEELHCNFNNKSPWQKLSRQLPGIGGDYFLVSGTGKYIRNIPVDPEASLGIIEVDKSGENYRTVWGYKDGGRPTSELAAHLQAHSVRKNMTNGRDRALIHTHPANLIALTYALELDTCSLTRLLWEMHAECIVVFPEGVEFLPWMMAGSDQIADATAEAFRKRNMVVWQYHGIFATGDDLDTACGLIDTVEKAAEIHIKVMSLGGCKQKPSIDTLRAIAANFGKVPAPDIIDRLV